MSKALSILYLGPISGTCLDRANALRRLCHQVEHVDLRLLLPKTKWVDRITWRLGGNLLAPLLMRGLANKLNGKRFDLCYVDGGEWVTPQVITLIRRYAEKVINYNIDDPLGSRDGGRFRAYRQALPDYDLNVVVRQENVAEAYELHAKKLCVFTEVLTRFPMRLEHLQRKTIEYGILTCYFLVRGFLSVDHYY
jgi:spore maturation protein CgeB